jgi:hypothetical protein
MVEQRSMVEINQDPALPRVRIEEAILNPEFRYRIQVDPKKFGYLLFRSGIPAEKVSQYGVSVKTWPDSTDPTNPSWDELKPSAYYNHHSRTVNFFTEHLLDQYYVAKDEAEIILSGAGYTVEHPFESFLTTKRLPNYLKEAPEERSRVFAETLFQRTLRRQMKKLFVHEANHAFVIREIKKGYSIRGFVDLISLGLHNLRSRIGRKSYLERYLRSPLEKKAFKAERNRELNDAAEGVLTLQFN